MLLSSSMPVFINQMIVTCFYFLYNKAMQPECLKKLIDSNWHASDCQGCNRDNHKRKDCKFRTHPDFNERGQWDGCLADRALRHWQRDEEEIKLNWGKRADGTILPRSVPDAAVPAAHLARMIRMIEINDIDGTMTVGIVMVIEKIKEVVVVVEKSISTKTKVRPISPVSSLT